MLFCVCVCGLQRQVQDKLLNITDTFLSLSCPEKPSNPSFPLWVNQSTNILIPSFLTLGGLGSKGERRIKVPHVYYTVSILIIIELCSRNTYL